MIKLILSPLLLFLALITAIIAVLFRFWKRTRTIEKAAFILLIAGTMSLAVLSLPITAHYIYLPLQNSIPAVEPGNNKDIDAIVVLMGGYRSRILRGIRAFKETGPPLLIISGFTGESTAQSFEHDSWSLLAVESGVPRDVVRNEYNSKNTHEHPIELLKMPEVDREMKIGVVTSSWHMPRALYEFRRYFPRAFPIPAGYKYEKADWRLKSFMPHADALNSSTLMIHEYIGSFWYRFRYGG